LSDFITSEFYSPKSGGEVAESHRFTETPQITRPEY